MSRRFPVLLWPFVLFLPILLSQGGVGSCCAQNRRVDRPPKLLIQLVMGAVSPDQLTAIWERLNPKGLPRLYAKGVVATDARYPQLECNSANGLATLITGASPSRHGVIGKSWYSSITGKREHFIEDLSCYALGVTGRAYAVSPKRLLVGSLVESWRQAYPSAHIYALALRPSEAVLLGGRAANGAFWMDLPSGRMVTSSYYTHQLPEWVKSYNDGVDAQRYLMQPWIRKGGRVGGVSRISQQPEPSRVEEVKVLGPRFTRLRYTPMGNTLLKDLLVQAVDRGGVGQRDTPSLFSVYLSSLEGISSLYGPESPQMEDALLRFNQEVADLLEYLDFALGEKEYAVVLTSAYAAAPSPLSLKAQRIPAGSFNPDRALLMLNAYFGAMYHEQKLVLGYAGLQFYLNMQAIETLRLPLAKIEEQAAEFLQDMSGVSAVYPSSVLRWGSDANPRVCRASQGFSNKRSGNLLVDLLPGWVLAPHFSPRAVNACCSTRPRVPLVLYGWKLPHRIIVGEVSMRDVVPTLCEMFHLPVPNANQGSPLKGVVDWDQ